MPFIKTFFRRLKTATFGLQITAVTLAFGLLIVSSYAFVNSVERGRLSAHTRNALDLTQARIEADLDRAGSMAAGLSLTVRSMILRDASLAEVQKYFSDITNYARHTDIPGFIQFFGYFDFYGGVPLDGDGPLPDTIDITMRPWYIAAAAANGDLAFTAPYVNARTKEVMLTCVRRIYNNEGEPLGIIGINIRLDAIEKHLAEMKPFESSIGLLHDANSVIMALSANRNAVGKRMSDIGDADDLKRFKDDMTKERKIYSEHDAKGKDGVRFAAAVKHIRKYNWYLCVITPKAEYYSHTRNIVWFFLGINALVLAVLCYVLLRLAKTKQKTDEFTKLVFDAVPLACHLWSGDKEMIMCNDAAVRMYGARDKQDYIGKHYGYSPEYQQCGGLSKSLSVKHLDKALAEGHHRFEWMHKTADGKPLPCEITLTRVKYSGEQAVIAYCRDMREEKAILEQLREAEEHIQSIYNATPLTITIWNAAGSIIDCNMEAIKVFGAKDKTDLIKNFVKNAPDFQADGKSSVEKITRILAKTFKDGGYRTNWEHRSSTGETIPFDLTFTRLRHKDGHIVVAYGRDMREHNAMMAQIREADERAMMMLDTAPVGVTMWDSNCNLLDYNLEAARVVGIENKAEYRARFAETAPEFQPDGKPTLQKLMETINEVFEKGNVRIPWHHNHLNGETIPFEARAFRVKYRDGDAVVVYCTDMREINAANEKMREAYHAEMMAEESNRAKSRFLAAMSHEIRTPMNVIIGVTDIHLQDDSLPPHLREAFTQIYNSGDLLLGIINDILDLSKIEAGKMEFTLAKYVLASLINDAAHLNMMHNSKPIEFELHIGENTPAHLYGDELRLKQILNNLLSNAFKFTEEGTVKLDVSVEEKDATDDVTLVLKISDTGQGMSEEQVGRLFTEYTRFNLEANRGIEGTGLGMNITRNLVGMMNGSISVESKPDIGTAVTVRLPQKRVGDARIGKELAENLRRFRVDATASLRRTQITRDYMPYGRVLIVDDVESNLYVGRGLMASYGLSIDTAASGFEAVEKIKNGNIYDIIFMDHMMPKMDGIEAAKIIRAAGYTMPIVALTANAVVGQADIFLGNGFDDFISKPIDIRQLNSILNKFIRDKQPPDVLEKSRKMKERALKHQPLFGRPSAEPELLGVFARDAAKALPVIESVAENPAQASDEEMRLFAVHVHAMKSALANIGETRLSQVAHTLEKAGKTMDKSKVALQSPSFIKALRGIIKTAEAESKLKPTAASDEDPALLSGQMTVIAEACRDYDERKASEALDLLKQKAWTAKTEDTLAKIAELLLHSSFEEAAELAEQTAG